MDKKEKFTKELKVVLMGLKDLSADSTKKINFLFGAGINYNITKNGMNWEELAISSTFDMLKVDRSTNSDYENNSLARSLKSDLGNNKLALSLSEEHIKLREFDVDWGSFTHKFKMDLYRMSKRFRLYLLTLNYDLVLEKVTGFKGDNFLKERSEKTQNTIHHMHGIVGDDRKVEEPRLLTLRDYVKNYKISRGKFRQFFQEVEKTNTPEYIFIMGASMSEEHILSALDESAFKKKEMKIIFFMSSPVDDEFMRQIKDKYLKINIIVLNYHFDGNQSISENFKDAWNILAKLLLGGSLSMTVSSPDKLDVREFVNRIKKDDLHTNKLFINSKVDAKRLILLNAEIQGKISPSYLLSFYKQIPGIINAGTYIDFKELSAESIEKFAMDVQDLIEIKDAHNNSQILKFLDRMLSKTGNLEFYSKNKFSKLAMARIQCDFQRWNHKASSLSEMAYKNRYLNFKELDINYMRFSSIPSKENYPFLHKYLLDKIIQLSVFNGYETPSLENVKKLYSANDIDKSWKFCILLSKDWKIFILNNKLELKELYGRVKSKSEARFYFSILYLFFVESDIAFIKDIAEKQSEFSEYPSTLDYIGTWGTHVKKVFALDHTQIDIKDEKYYFSSIEDASREFDKIMAKPEVNRGEQLYRFTSRLNKLDIEKVQNPKIFAKLITKFFNTINNCFINVETTAGFTKIFENINEFIDFSVFLKSLETPTPIKIELDQKIQDDWEAGIEFKIKNKHVIKNTDLYNFVYLKTFSTYYADSYLISLDWFKRVRDNKGRKVKKYLLDVLGGYPDFNDEQAKFLVHKTKKLTLKNIDDLYIEAVVNGYDSDVTPGDFLKLINIKGCNSTYLQFRPYFRYFFWRKTNNMENNKRFEFLNRAKESFIKYDEELAHFTERVKISFLLTNWVEGDKTDFILPDEVSNINMEDLILTVRDFEKDTIENMNDEVSAELFKRANMRTGDNYSLDPFWVLDEVELKIKTKESIVNRIFEYIKANKFDAMPFAREFDSLLQKWDIKIPKEIEAIIKISDNK